MQTPQSDARLFVKPAVTSEVVTNAQAPTAASRLLVEHDLREASFLEEPERWDGMS